MDPVQIAQQYGLPWGINIGLALAIAYLYKTTVPKTVWESSEKRAQELAGALASLTADVRTLLAIVQRGGERP